MKAVTNHNSLLIFLLQYFTPSNNTVSSAAVAGASTTAQHQRTPCVYVRDTSGYDKSATLNDPRVRTGCIFLKISPYTRGQFQSMQG